MRDFWLVLLFFFLSVFPIIQICQASMPVQLKGVVVDGEFVRAIRADKDDNKQGMMCSQGWIPARIDSKPGVTRFPPEMYAEFRDRFRSKMVQYSPVVLPAGGLFDTCYNFSSIARDQGISAPDIALVFSDKRSCGEEEGDMVVDLKVAHVWAAIVDKDAYTGTYCLAFAPTPKGQDFAHIGSLL